MFTEHGEKPRCLACGRPSKQDTCPQCAAWSREQERKTISRLQRNQLINDVFGPDAGRLIPPTAGRHHVKRTAPDARLCYGRGFKPSEAPFPDALQVQPLSEFPPAKTRRPKYTTSSARRQSPPRPSMLARVASVVW